MNSASTHLTTTAARNSENNLSLTIGKANPGMRRDVEVDWSQPRQINVQMYRRPTPAAWANRSLTAQR